jgi:hypothetical protein
MFSKLEKIINENYPNFKIVSPTPSELFVEKWGKGNISDENGHFKVKDPTISVFIESKELNKSLPMSLQRKTVLVDVEREQIVAVSG